MIFIWYKINIKMTQYSTLNVKLSNSQLIKSKSTTINGTEETLNLSSNLIGSSNDENNPHKLLLIDTQVSKIRKTFTNGSSSKLWNTQLSKMIQSGRIFPELIAAIRKAMLLAGKEVLKEGISLAPKLAPTLTGKATEYYINKIIKELNKSFFIK